MPLARQVELLDREGRQLNDGVGLHVDGLSAGRFARFRRRPALVRVAAGGAFLLGRLSSDRLRRLVRGGRLDLRQLFGGS